MKTKLLYAKDITAKDQINEAAEILKNGGLVAVPTETVYGLAASALNEKAVANIFKAKGRPNDNPLIVHIAEFSELENIVSEVSDLAKKCMDAFWPGPFTAVLPKKDIIPSCVSGGLKTVAVRMPANAVTAEIIKKSGLPLAAPSANTSGAPSPSTPYHVIEDLSGKIDAIVVSSDCSVGVESTVVSFAVEPPRLLRPGGITVEQLRRFIPDLVIDPAVTAEPEKDVQVASPGMKYKHYSPKANTVMVSATAKDFAEYCNENDDIDLVLCFDEDIPLLKIPYISLGGKNDHPKQAELLFSALRDIDKRNSKGAAIHAPAKDGMGLAVYNRLIRAVGFKEIML